MFEVLHLCVLPSIVASFNKTLFDATNNPACIVFIIYKCCVPVLSCFMLFVR